MELSFLRQLMVVTVLLMHLIFMSLMLGCASDTTQIKKPLTKSKLKKVKTIDWRQWRLNLPIDHNHDGKGDNVDERELSAGYSQAPYFYLDDDGGWVFRCPNVGARTSRATKYVRVELREMLRRGNVNIRVKGVAKNNWVLSTAPERDRRRAGGVDGVLHVDMAVNHVSTTGLAKRVGRIVIGQIHARDNEPIRLYYRKLPGNDKGAIYFAHETAAGDERYYEMIGSKALDAPNPVDGIALNERFRYEIRLLGSQLRVTLSRLGKPDIIRQVDIAQSGYDTGGDYLYFKTGLYNQNNGGDIDDYAQVTLYSATTRHGSFKHPL